MSRDEGRERERDEARRALRNVISDEPWRKLLTYMRSTTHEVYIHCMRV